MGNYNSIKLKPKTIFVCSTALYFINM